MTDERIWAMRNRDRRLSGEPIEAALSDALDALESAERIVALAKGWAATSPDDDEYQSREDSLVAAINSMEYAGIVDPWKELATERIARQKAEAERDNWQETAAQHHRNEQYYKGLLVEIGDSFGLSARTCDDGSVSEGVLVSKVPELVKAELTERDAAVAALTYEHDIRDFGDDLAGGIRMLGKQRNEAEDERDQWKRDYDELCDDVMVLGLGKPKNWRDDGELVSEAAQVVREERDAALRAVARLREAMEDEFGLYKAPTAAQDTCWFVELRRDGNFRGWYTAPSEGLGPWSSDDPLQAKRYSRQEAEAVAQALNFFRIPYGLGNWVATEHVFLNTKGGANVSDTDAG